MAVVTYGKQITPYQAIKGGSFITITAYEEKTRAYAPALFYMTADGITAENGEIGRCAGYLNGREFNAHIRRIAEKGFEVCSWNDEETARSILDRAMSDYWAYHGDN